jgi:hypothetical protein
MWLERGIVFAKLYYMLKLGELMMGMYETVKISSPEGTLIIIN